METGQHEHRKLPIADNISQTSVSPSDCAEPDRPIHDDIYYFADVIFLVEGCLFKVPRRYLEQDSEVFRTMFQLPVSKSTISDGMSDEQPLRLDGIAKCDFRQLLRVIYPSTFRQEETLSLDDWISVLKLSTMWNLEKVRELAIEKMSVILVDAVDIMLLGVKYHVDKWFISAVSHLVKRAQPMGVEDVERLGTDYALKIAAIRECCLPPGFRNGWEIREPRGKVAQALDLTSRIRADFQFNSGT